MTAAAAVDADLSRQDARAERVDEHRLVDAEARCSGAREELVEVGVICAGPTVGVVKGCREVGCAMGARRWKAPRV